MPQLSTVEYEFVEAGSQAAGRAICPYCSGWHNRSDGAPVSEACDARYIRVRKVAIFARGKAHKKGSGVRVPTAGEKKTALDHAANIVFN